MPNADRVRHPPPKRLTPIARKARIALEDALLALRELHAADPFVCVALVQLAFTGWPLDPSAPLADRRDVPPSNRAAIAAVRERTTELKAHAVARSSREGSSITSFIERTQGSAP